VETHKFKVAMAAGAGMTPLPPPLWTMEMVTAGLIRFYREIAGVGLMFPRGDRPIAVRVLSGHQAAADRGA
jgi:hypothetical protein